MLQSPFWFPLTINILNSIITLLNSCMITVSYKGTKPVFIVAWFNAQYCVKDGSSYLSKCSKLFKMFNLFLLNMIYTTIQTPPPIFTSSASSLVINHNMILCCYRKAQKLMFIMKCKKRSTNYCRWCNECVL
jgi:hypothetical protein